MDRPVKERLIGAVVLVTVAWLLIPVFLDAPPQRTESDEGWVTLPSAVAAADSAQPTRRETIVYQQQPEPEPQVPTATVESLPAPAMDAAEDNPVATTEAGRTEQVQAQAVEATATTEAAASLREREPEPDQPATPAPTTAASDAEGPAEQSPPAVAQQSVEDPAPTAAQPAPSGQLWAVQLGSFSDADNAQRLAAKFRDEGLPAFISKVQSGGRTLHRVRIGPQPDRASSDAIVVRLTAAGQAARTVPHP
ncbi:MAG: SPOR domain-containing protein [Pseudomonadota bacterium]